MNKDELILLLKNLAAIEGFLWSIDNKNTSFVFESYIDPLVELAVKKLNEL